MRIIDENLLDEFRAAGPCEWCGHRCVRRHPHHIFAKGMGGGGRLDVRLNLVGICFGCHVDHHLGNRPLRCDLLALVAAREGLLQGQIEERIYQLLRAPKREAV